MHVFRLENEDGRGPYSIRRPSSTDWCYPADKRHDAHRFATYLNIEWDEANGINRFDEDPHPSPFQDGLAREGYGWSALDNDEHCGFESEEQMRAWFFRAPHDPQALHDMGLFVTEWKVHGRHVRKGGKQLVFFRNKAELIRRVSPLEFPVEVLR